MKDLKVGDRVRKLGTEYKGRIDEIDGILCQIKFDHLISGYMWIMTECLIKLKPPKPKPKRLECWVNFYPAQYGVGLGAYGAHLTRDAALKACTGCDENTRAAVHMVECPPGYKVVKIKIKRCKHDVLDADCYECFPTKEKKK